MKSRWARPRIVTSGGAELGSSGLERDPARIVAFSDGVFAIAITLLILEIKTPTNGHNLTHKLIELWPSYLAYAFTFLLIGQVWVNHHAVFDHVRTADWGLMFCNILLLANVAFLPFAAAVLATALHSGTGARAAVAFYGLTCTVGSALFTLSWWHVRRAALFRSTMDLDTARAFTLRFRIGPLVYAVGAAVATVMPVAGLVLFTVPSAMFWLPVGSQAGDVSSKRPEHIEAAPGPSADRRDSA